MSRPSPTAISGVALFVFVPEFLGRRILLTGEMHDTAGACSSRAPGTVDVHTWLRDLADASPVCLDVLAEADYITRGRSPAFTSPHRLGDVAGSYSTAPTRWAGGVPPGDHRHNPVRNYHAALLAVMATFSSCFTEDPEPKATCAGGSTRFHYVDVRRVGADFNMRHALALAIPDDRRASLFAPRDVARISADVCACLLDPSSGPEARGRYVAALRLVAETAGLTVGLDDAIRRDLAWLDAWHWLLGKLAAKLDPRLTIGDIAASLRDAYPVARRMRKLDPVVTDICLVDMDMYVLMRMFEVFDAPKMARGPAKCAGSRTLNNIVYHAGRTHTLVCHVALVNLAARLGIPPPHAYILEARAPEDACMRLPAPFDFFAPSAPYT